MYTYLVFSLVAVSIFQCTNASCTWMFSWTNNCESEWGDEKEFAAFVPVDNGKFFTIFLFVWWLLIFFSPFLLLLLARAQCIPFCRFPFLYTLQKFDSSNVPVSVSLSICLAIFSLLSSVNTYIIIHTHTHPAHSAKQKRNKTNVQVSVPRSLSCFSRCVCFDLHLRCENNLTRLSRFSIFYSID